jgi:hypothetical protein
VIEFETAFFSGPFSVPDEKCVKTRHARADLLTGQPSTTALRVDRSGLWQFVSVQLVEPNPAASVKISGLLLRYGRVGSITSDFSNVSIRIQFSVRQCRKQLRPMNLQPIAKQRS